jgi:hypothetical protein
MNIVARTNLYSERLEERRRRRAAQVARNLSAIAVLCAASFWLVSKCQRDELRREHSAKKASEASLHRQLLASRENVEKRAEEVKRRDAVLELDRQQWRWASILEAVFAATPVNVEMSMLEIKTPAQGDRILQISGRSAGKQPRMECDKCRLLLVDILREAGYSVTSQILKLEDSPTTIRFENVDYPAADFVIELRFSFVAHGKLVS